MHVLTVYGRDALCEQCVLLFTHGQNPSHGHLLLGYAGAWHMKGLVKSKAPVFRAVRQAHRTGRACPSLVGMSITDLLAMDLAEARTMLNIPDPDWYRECHRVWCSEGIDPYDMRSEEHTSELQSLIRTSYAVFCLKKKITISYGKHSEVNTTTSNSLQKLLFAKFLQYVNQTF